MTSADGSSPLLPASRWLQTCLHTLSGAAHHCPLCKLLFDSRSHAVSHMARVHMGSSRAQASRLPAVDIASPSSYVQQSHVEAYLRAIEDAMAPERRPDIAARDGAGARQIAVRADESEDHGDPSRRGGDVVAAHNSTYDDEIFAFVRQQKAAALAASRSAWDAWTEQQLAARGSSDVRTCCPVCDCSLQVASSGTSSSGVAGDEPAFEDHFWLVHAGGAFSLPLDLSTSSTPVADHGAVMRRKRAMEHILRAIRRPAAVCKGKSSVPLLLEQLAHRRVVEARARHSLTAMQCFISFEAATSSSSDAEGDVRSTLEAATAELIASPLLASPPLAGGGVVVNGQHEHVVDAGGGARAEAVTAVVAAPAVSHPPNQHERASKEWKLLADIERRAGVRSVPVFLGDADTARDVPLLCPVRSLTFGVPPPWSVATEVALPRCLSHLDGLRTERVTKLLAPGVAPVPVTVQQLFHRMGVFVGVLETLQTLHDSGLCLLGVPLLDDFVVALPGPVTAVSERRSVYSGVPYDVLWKPTRLQSIATAVSASSQVAVDVREQCTRQWQIDMRHVGVFFRQQGVQLPELTQARWSDTFGSVDLALLAVKSLMVPTWNLVVHRGWAEVRTNARLILMEETNVASTIDDHNGSLGPPPRLSSVREHQHTPLTDIERTTAFLRATASAPWRHQEGNISPLLLNQVVVDPLSPLFTEDAAMNGSDADDQPRHRSATGAGGEPILRTHVAPLVSAQDTVHAFEAAIVRAFIIINAHDGGSSNDLSNAPADPTGQNKGEGAAATRRCADRRQAQEALFRVSEQLLVVWMAAACPVDHTARRFWLPLVSDKKKKRNQREAVLDATTTQPQGPEEDESRLLTAMLEAGCSLAAADLRTDSLVSVAFHAVRVLRSAAPSARSNETHGAVDSTPMERLHNAVSAWLCRDHPHSLTIRGTMGDGDQVIDSAFHALFSSSFTQHDNCKTNETRSHDDDEAVTLAATVRLVDALWQGWAYAAPVHENDVVLTSVVGLLTTDKRDVRAWTVVA